MAVLSITTGKNAKQGDAPSFTKCETSFPGFDKIINAIKVAWPSKTAAHVAHLTGTSERAVKFWLAGETRMSADAIAALLRTHDGYLILAAIMGDANPPWWVAMQLAYKIRKSRRVIAAEQKRTEELRLLQSQIDIFDNQ